MAVMSIPVWTSRTKMVRLRIKVEIFFITPVMTRSAPIRCAYRTSQPPQACRLLPSAAAFTEDVSVSWNRRAAAAPAGLQIPASRPSLPRGDAEELELAGFRELPAHLIADADQPVALI